MQNGRTAIATPLTAAAAQGARLAQPAALLTRDGRFVTRGVVELEQRDGCWAGVLRRLDAPGLAASLYFGSGVRDVMLRLADGREVQARLTDTQFDVSGRVYRVSCCAPLMGLAGATA
jgi:hypothetical protein